MHLCALGAFLCLAFDGNLDSVHLTSCTLLAAVAVNLIEDSAPPVLALFQSSLLGWLGTLSFSLYIWQQPFFLSMGGGLPLLVALPLTFACAFWSYTRVERPARDWLNRHWTARMAELGKAWQPLTKGDHC